VLITGGASGIGAELVRHFARQDARCAFLDIDDAAAHRLCEDLGDMTYIPVFTHCDITVVEDLETAIRQLSTETGPFEVLVNNAARDDRMLISDMTQEAWDAFQAVNLRHVVFASKAVLPGMAAAGGGSIINFSSPTFRRRTAGTSGYATAKAAIEGLGRVMSREMGEVGVRVNTIMPGWTMTERQRDLWLTPEAERVLMETQCLKLHVMPDDIARMVTFLASDDARAITAQVFVVDAGLV
jgi:NAD(P)-dependent dehydrogenase (short-subunit alcohol dehydrogenase family)